MPTGREWIGTDNTCVLSFKEARLKLIECVGVALGLMSGCAMADPASLVTRQDVYASPSAAAAKISSLDRASAVDVVSYQGGWAEIRSGKVHGWVRLLALTSDLSSHAGQSAASQGENANTAVMLAGIRGLPQPRPSAHALILGIGNYQGEGITPLKGVRHDMDSARMMANAMGVPPENMTVLSDDAATLAGMQKALDDLERQTMPGDQVFFYFSGHGARYPITADGKTCGEGLVSFDKQAFSDRELQQTLNRIALKARRVVAFIDACHSGGVTTRGLFAQKASGLTVKYWSREDIQRCAAPSNVITRGLEANANTTGLGANNFLYVAAARNDEVSLDDARAGGLATSNWLACMGGDARDLNQSGGLSADEIRQCAQQRIDRVVTEATGFRPPHLQLYGNKAMTLLASLNPETPPVQSIPDSPPAKPPVAETQTRPSAPPPPVQNAQPGPAAPPPPAEHAHAAPPPTSSATVNPSVAALGDLFANRDDRRRVVLSSDKPSYRIRADKVNLQLTSSNAGYVYLLMVGSDGKTFDMLFPNKKDRFNLIKAGETLQLPRPGWSIRPAGPAGADTLLAVVSDTPRDFTKLGMRPAGPFSMIEASPATNRDIVLVTATPANADDAHCKVAGAQRTLAIAEECSDAYGAAMLTIRESE